MDLEIQCVFLICVALSFPIPFFLFFLVSLSRLHLIVLLTCINLWRIQIARCEAVLCSTVFFLFFLFILLLIIVLPIVLLLAPRVLLLMLLKTAHIVLPCIKTVLGTREFSMSSLKLRNSMPSVLRSVNSLTLLQTKFETHLFKFTSYHRFLDF